MNTMYNLTHAHEEVLDTEGVLVSTTSGVSMYPMLRDRMDTVIIKKPTGRLKKYDVAFYKRGEKYILHRIIKVTDNGYVILGDNCEKKEYDITDKNILGVLDSFYRGEKYITLDKFSYKLYVRARRITHPARLFWRKFKRKVRRAIKK